MLRSGRKDEWDRPELCRSGHVLPVDARIADVTGDRDADGGVGKLAITAHGSGTAASVNAICVENNVAD
jgi:hypothetical protein